jgi:hypothetical protein
MEGFDVLMRKEFFAFGHKFHERLGVGEHNRDRSPVVLMYLDCVFQILCQHSHAFEFSEAYLLAWADALNTRWFGELLHDSERELVSHIDVHVPMQEPVEPGERKVVSIFAHLQAQRDRCRHTAYAPAEKVRCIRDSKSYSETWPC